jgi:hypothetical protein
MSKAFLLVAIVCFALAAFGVQPVLLPWTPVGLAFFASAQLV